MIENLEILRKRLKREKENDGMETVWEKDKENGSIKK